MSLSPMVQSAEKGAWPEVMCATEDGLEQRALYGPTGRGSLSAQSVKARCTLMPMTSRSWTSCGADRRGKQGSVGALTENKVKNRKVRSWALRTMLITVTSSTMFDRMGP